MRILYFLDDERAVSDVTWIDYPTYDCSVAIKDPLLFLERVFSEIIGDGFSNFIDGNFNEVILSLDHDLQYFKDGVEITGYDMLKMLVERLVRLGVHHYKLPTIYYHSKNPVGVENMSQYWDSFIKHKTQS